VTQEEIEQVQQALTELLSIVEFEYERDPEPEDLPSWKRAIDKGNDAVQLLQEKLK
jgi:hypothetical protein